MSKPAVVAGAQVRCIFGAAPAELVVLPTKKVMIEGRPAADIECFEIDNIATFGECTSLANPEVASATAAALGVLTPMPCVPALSPWIPTTMTLIGDTPALVEGSMCMCDFGGVIEILDPGTTTTTE